MERVSIIQGELPILLIAPYGVDDFNTGFITDLISSEMECFAIINKGWERSATVDSINDKANCNNVKHIHEDVVKEEFLDPILRTVAKIQKKLDERVYIINIQGCDDEIKNLDVILGYGEGRSSNYTCGLKIKDAFVHFLEKEKLSVYEGKNKYNAKSKNNLCQLFRQWYPNPSVHSIQLKITNELRSHIDSITSLSEKIISALDGLLLFDDATIIRNRPPNYI